MHLFEEKMFFLDKKLYETMTLFYKIGAIQVLAILGVPMSL